MMMTNRNQLAEARQLVANLAKVDLRNQGDARFVQSWANYLDHAGDRAAIGRYRMFNLRVVASAYGLCDQPDHADLQSPGLD